MGTADHQTSVLTDDGPIAADDIGFLSGVVIVDRLRTVAGVGLDVAAHVARFQRSCGEVGIGLPSQPELIERVHSVVQRHGSHFAPGDCSIVMLATPGRLGAQPPRATLMFHATALDWRRLADWYQSGQRLKISTHRNVPPACWSPAIKTRARLHYYLADRQVHLETGDAHAGAVLLDADGFLTETSAANLLIVEDGHLISPRREKILNGISWERTWRLAGALGMRIAEDDISPERAIQAEAILLCGSSGCIWPASGLDQRIYAEPARHPSYQQLAQAWRQELQFDYVQQALDLARSTAP